MDGNIIMSDFFKSGKYRGKKFIDIITNERITLKKISNSKHVAYRKFNVFYSEYLKQQHQQKLNNTLSELRTKKITKDRKKIIIDELNEINNVKYIENVVEKTTMKGQIYRLEFLLKPEEIETNKRLKMRNIINDIMNEVNTSLSSYKNVDFQKIKLIMNNSTGFKSFFIDRDDIINGNSSNINNRISHEIENYVNEYGGTGDEVYTFNRVVVSSIYQNRKGACNNGKKELHESMEFDNIHMLIGFNNFQGCKFEYTIKNYKSKNNNCGLVSLIKAVGLNANKIKADLLRKKYGIALNTYISCDELGTIANNEFNVNLIVINTSGFVLHQTNSKYDNHVVLLLDNEHFKHVELKNIKIKTKCKLCGKHININSNEHKCNNNIMEFYQTQITKKSKSIITRNVIKSDKIDYDNDLFFFDFETFQFNLSFVVYAVGFIHNGVYNQYYGINAMSDFINYIVNNVEDKIFVAYNGGRFDFILLLRELINVPTIKINGYLKNGSRLLNYEFNGNKIFDLYNFTLCSLKDACESYKIDADKCKSEFNHNLINSWDDVETYKSEILPYLQLDLISMKELFIKFNDEMYELENMNITEFPTLSAMAYKCWLNSIEKIKKETGDNIFIEIPTKDKYDFIRRSIYGGKVAACIKSYYNEQYNILLHQELEDMKLSYDEYIQSPESVKNNIDKIISKKLKYEDVYNSNDYIFNSDVSSLYPTSMAGNDLIDVQFPSTPSRWSDNPTIEFANNKYGFYEIEYESPTDINYTILPRRLKNNMIRWDVMKGTGVYTNVDIRNIMKYGYKIKFIGKCLIYDATRNDLFKPYINKYYSLKAAEDNKPAHLQNPARRNICKILQNALYGKQLQRSVFESEMICNSINEVYEFLKEKDFIDLEILSDCKVLIKAQTLEENESDNINKPSQLGAFILSYSREVMLFYNSLLDPELKKFNVSYGDTDSMHIFGHDHKKLKDMGYIPDKCQLGYLSNDIKKNGLIINEINLGAKLYMYKYIDENNDIKTVMKAKGLPKKYLSQQFFIQESGEVVIKDSFIKTFGKLNNNEKSAGIGMFTIRKHDLSRKFNAVTWQGRILKGNKYYPHGYTGNIL